MLISVTWIFLTPILFSGVNAHQEIFAPHEGFLTPQFSLESPDNTNYAVSDYSDRPVLIFFWASWCSICKRIMPDLQRVYEVYQPKGFEILAVNATYQDNFLDAVEYFTAQEFTYKMLLDTQGEVSSLYQLHAFPTAVLLGPDGVITDLIIGSGMNSSYLFTQLDQFFTNGD